MSYTRTTWSTGDSISATKLNNLEQGVVDANTAGGGSGSSSTISIDITATPYGADKTGGTSAVTPLKNAINAVSALGGGEIVFPAGTYRIDIQDADQAGTDTSIIIPAGVVLRGVGPASILNFTCQTTNGYAVAFTFAGTAPGFRKLKIQRGNVMKGVILHTGTSDRAFLEDVELDGKIGTYATDYIHGLQTGLGSLTNFRWTGGKAHHLTYPLFQSSPSNGLTRGIEVAGIEFTANTATDLEFNAPHSAMSGIDVHDCYFHDQDVSATPGGWFAIGFARVNNSRFHHNRVENYQGEAVHIEDGSYDIKVDHNSFYGCALTSGLSYMQVISASFRIFIDHNRFDAVPNASISGNYPYMLGLQAGGTGTTDGGNPFISPYEVNVDHNHFQCQTANGIYVEANARTKIDSNQFKGNGSIDGSGNFVGANAGWGIDFYGGGGVLIVGNDFEGIMYGIRPRQPSETVNTGGQASILATNRFSTCKYAILLVNPERMNVTGNLASQCEFPLTTGQAAASSKILSIVGNSAFDCKWPMNFNGKYTVVATGTGTVGSGITLNVAATQINIPSGVAFTFPGGATFTTTTARAASPSAATTLTGNLTGANIASGAGGTSAFGSIPHSTTSADNHVLAVGNLDTVAGIYT